MIIDRDRRARCSTPAGPLIAAVASVGLLCLLVAPALTDNILRPRPAPLPKLLSTVAPEKDAELSGKAIRTLAKFFGFDKLELPGIVIGYNAPPCGEEPPPCEGDEIAIFGHSSPDTDAISAAIIREWELTHPPKSPHSGYTGPTTAVCAKAYINSDEPNPETAWVLEYFGIPKPPILKHINDIPFPVFGTVDTNNVAEMPPGTADVVSDQIQSIIDHHKLTGLVTLNPDEIDVRPIGSAGAVLFSRSRLANRPIPGAGCEKNIAGLMLATILSDTLGLTSSTTTESDKVAVDILAPLAGINDTMGWTKQMLEAKSSIAQYTPADIVMLDSKLQGPFTDPTGATFLLRVAVQETITPDVLFDQTDEIGAACQAQLKIDQASTNAAMLGDDGTNIVRDCLFFIVDVRNSFKAIDPSYDVVPKATYLPSSSEYAAELVREGNFLDSDGNSITPTELPDGRIDLVGVQSRKRQIVPGIGGAEGSATKVPFPYPPVLGGR